MRKFILISTLITIASTAIHNFDVSTLTDIMNLRILPNLNQGISPTNITEDEYLKNIFMSASIQPSLITTGISIACLIGSIKLQNLSIKDLNLDYEPIGLSANFTNVKLLSFECSDQDISGLMPVDNTTTDLIFPKINAQLSFNYSISFGHDRPESGNASVNIDSAAWQARYKTYQEEEEHKKEGPVKAKMISNTFNYTSIEGIFSDIYTQTEWDVLFENPENFKKIVQTLGHYFFEKTFKNLDLRQLINITFGKGVNLLFGITSPLEFPAVDMPTPDNRSIDLKMHTIVTMPKGERIEGIFPVDMQASPLSRKYSSLMFNVDILNKILSATTTTQSLSFSFNQKILDLIHFSLLKLNTTALKPFFPNLETTFGYNLGVYFKIYLPQYDANRCYIKNSAGLTIAVLAAQLEIYVTTDQASYYNTTLAQCVANSTCVRANTVEMDLYIKLPLAFTTDKKIALGFADVEIANVIVTPTSFDPELLKAKLNNFLDVSLPHLLPEIDISAILAPFLVSADALEDQRIAIGIALDQ